MKKMSQGNNSFVIRDASGQRHTVKLLPNGPALPVSLKANPVKFVKIASPAHTSKETQAPVFKTVKLAGINCTSKLVQVPPEALSRFKLITPKIEPGLEKTEQSVEGIELSDFLPIEGSSVDGSEEQNLVVDVPESHNSIYKTMSQHGTRRKLEPDNETQPEYTTKRRRHADKVGKGLRHFSMKVCEKVRTKGFTSYNEVADELVMEFATGMYGYQHYDQKNIRRRVYDALNVLMAMNIISKDKKEIRWLGLPNNSVQESVSLEKEKQDKILRIQKKSQHLQDLILQHISFKSLISRNKEAESRGVKPSPSSAIHLPFIVVNTSDKAIIDCNISNDKTEYLFTFNKKFQIHDDIDILKRMGLLFGLDKGECTEEEIEKVKSMVPKSLESYVEQMGRGTPLSTLLVNEDFDDDDESADEGEGDLEGEGEGDAEGEGAEREGDDYSSDSTDVDV